MTQTFDPATTFVRLGSAGEVEPVALTPAFWGRSVDGPSSDRFLGVFDFQSSDDLHASLQEMHPAGDELIVVIEGAVDVVVSGDADEQMIALEPGRATIVPRGVWHRLVMRRPGRLLFVNHRSGMQSRRV